MPQKYATQHVKIGKSNIKGYPGMHVKIHIDDPALDFSTAKDIAKQKARDRCADPMLLSW